jgi:WD40 repeat protein
VSTPLCPNCNSDEVLFSQKKNLFTCENCETKFEPPARQSALLRIFISYGRDEYASLAERVKSDLLNRGHEVWFDKERLKEGADWEHYIDEGLNWVSKDASIGRVVFIMTPHSVRRPDGYCLNEIAKALGKSVPIIPVMLVFCEPPLSIYRLQYLDMQECYPPDDKPGSYVKQLERLILALEDQKLDFDGIQSRLLKTLEPISFSADISKLLQDFTGRQWVFDSVDNWLHDPEGSKVFWLTGAPGVGKSAIAAWVRDNRREIGAFHFCDIHSEEKRNPSKLVRSIAYQLSTQLPAYEERLKSLNMEGIVQEYHEAYTLFDKLIVQPMADNFPPPDRTIVILIDALDEATHQKRNEISLFLSRCADKTPTWLRFLVTSRPEPEIKAALQSLSPYLLDTSTDENRADINNYLQMKLPQITDTQIAELLDKSEGVFLYVRHVCGEVKSGNLSLDRLDQFPKGLGDIYLQFFERQFGKEMDYYSKEIRPLLCLILAAFEPLHLGFLKQILGYSNRMELFDRLDRLGSLFPRSGSEDENTIAPFHRSLSDWLCDKDHSGIFYLDSEYGHRLLADYGWNEYLLSTEVMSDYSLEWLPSHLMELEEFERFVQVAKNFEYLMTRTKAGMLDCLLADFRELLPQLPQPHRSELRIEQAFFREKAHILRRGNDEWTAYKILLQLAIEHADDSPLTIGAEKFLADGKCDWAWLRREMRVEHAEIDPCISVLEGHTSWVNGALMLQDGKVLSWSDDRTIRKWSIDGEQLTVFQGHPNSVKGVIVLSDGHILSWSEDSLRIWTMEGELIKVMECGSFKDVCIWDAMELSDGRILSKSNDWISRIWDANGALLAEMEGLAFGNDGIVNDKFITKSKDDVLKIWNLDCCLVTVLEGHTSKINGYKIFPNGRILSWSDDKDLRIWDDKGRIIKVMSGHTDKVTRAQFLPDGRILSISDDKTLRIWDIEGNFIKVLEGHLDYIYGAISLSDGKILSWSRDSTLRLWSDLGESLNVMSGHNYGVNGVAILLNGRILSWAKDNTLRQWSVSGDCLAVMPMQGDKYGSVSNVCVTSSGNILSSSSFSRDHSIYVWSAEGELLNKLQGHTSESLKTKIDAENIMVSFSESSGSDFTLRIWNLSINVKQIRLAGHGGTVQGCFIDNNQLLTYSQSDNIFYKWDLEGNIISKFEGHANCVKGIISLTNGNILSWSDDPVFYIWNTAGEMIASPFGHAEAVRGVEILPNGNILSWSYDGNVAIWSIHGELINIFSVNTEGPIDDVTITPDLNILSWSRHINCICLWSMDGKLLRKLEINKTDYNILAVKVLDSGQITAIASGNYTAILWDSGLELLECYKAGLGLIPEIFRDAWDTKKKIARQNHNGFDVDSGGTVLYLMTENNSKKIFWQPETKIISKDNCRLGSTILDVFHDGCAVVTEANGQVCFLRTYYGNQRVTIEELEASA